MLHGLATDFQLFECEIIQNYFAWVWIIFFHIASIKTPERRTKGGKQADQSLLTLNALRPEGCPKS
jgi:hypothetical protein